MLDISTTFLGNYLIAWHFAQSFNSLGQNPCTVAAHLISTCHSGCEWSSLFVLRPRALSTLSSHLFRSVDYQSAPQGKTLCARLSQYRHVLVQHCRIFPPECMRRMPGRSLGHVRYTSLSSFQILGLMYLTSAICRILPTAQAFWVPGSEFPVSQRIHCV